MNTSASCRTPFVPTFQLSLNPRLWPLSLQQCVQGSLPSQTGISRVCSLVTHRAARSEIKWALPWAGIGCCYIATAQHYHAAARLQRSLAACRLLQPHQTTGQTSAVVCSSHISRMHKSSSSAPAALHCHAAPAAHPPASHRCHLLAALLWKSVHIHAGTSAEQCGHGNSVDSQQLSSSQ